MTLHPDDIGQFFSTYAGLFNRALAGEADLKAIAGHFTSCFIESHPGGVTCGTNGDEFVTVMEKGYAHYRAIGTKSMTVTGVDSTSIADDHSAATVHWRSEYLTRDGREVTIDFDVHYLLKRDHGELRIFGFIAGDEEGTLRRHGVI